MHKCLLPRISSLGFLCVDWVCGLFVFECGLPIWFFLFMFVSYFDDIDDDDDQNALSSRNSKPSNLMKLECLSVPMPWY
jgi:hypothetical protein